MRHAVGKWYVSMTAVFREGKIFVWEATFFWTLQGFQAAVLRRCYNIKKHFANREHTNLVAVVSEEERAKYPRTKPLCPSSRTATTHSQASSSGPSMTQSAHTKRQRRTAHQRQ